MCSGAHTLLVLVCTINTVVPQNIVQPLECKAGIKKCTEVPGRGKYNLVYTINYA